MLAKLLVGVLLMLPLGAGAQAARTAPAPAATANTFEAVADYVAQHGKLPPNYITKAQARALGWDARKGNLNQVAPGKSIGGDVFGNFEGRLPKAKGRVWREADINYRGGRRGADRLLYSSDGLIYKTTDHYQTFTRIR